ncbi:MAG: helix-turn-helix transcriptional regulator [Alphaproteobacteria bacterium]
MSRTDDELLFELIGLIYDAAYDPEQWTVFLDNLGALIDGHDLVIAERDVNTGLEDVLASSRCPMEMRAFVYDGPFGVNDEWAAAQARAGLPLGVPAVTESALPTSDLIKTAFYNDFLTKFDAKHGIGFNIAQSSGKLLFSVAHRSALLGPFGERELSIYRRLIPHFARAHAISQKLLLTAAHHDTTLHALDSLTHGVVFLTHGDSVLYMNKAAEAIVALADGIALGFRGDIRLSRQDDTKRLRELIDRAARGNDGGVLAVSRPSGRRPFSMLVAPTPRQSRMAIGLPIPMAVLFVADPDAVSIPPIKALCTMYGIGRREAQVLQALVSGDRVEDIGEKLGIKWETVRSHIKSLLGKMGAERQSDLIRIVLTAANMFPDSERHT